MENKISDLQQFVTNDKTAPAYWMLDILWVIKASGEQTNHQFSLVEQTMPYSSVPPPHFHADMDEMFYVIEGEITIWINGKISKFTPGTFGFIPRKTVHYFKITSKENCRALNMYTPAGFEEGIIRNGKKAESLTLPPKGEKFSAMDEMHQSVDIKMVDLLKV